MNAIFACKLYKSSTRKQKIQAALKNPVNAELVKQLSECLDDEYKPLTKLNDGVIKNVSDTNLASESNSNGSSTSSHPRSSSGLGGLSSALSGLDDNPSISEKYGDDLDAEGNEAFDDTQIDNNDADSTITDDVSSSTAVKGTSIQADTTLTKPLVENQVSLSGLAGELKGTLNARNTTAGVNRVSVKSNEIWIHYNDDINLNNVMTAVIDTLNSANYHILIFNRLARTDNAIVFTVNGNDTANAMDPMSNE